jgi:hypothetical protein
MLPIRQQVILRTLFIIFIVIPAILYNSENKLVIAIEVIFLLYGLYQFIRLAYQFQEFIDDLYPLKISKTAKVKPFDKVEYNFSITLFFVAMVFQISISWWTENTIFGMKLFWQSLIIGVLIAIITTILLKWKHPSIYQESNRRISVHFGLFLGFAFFLPALAIFINHIFADKVANCKIYKIDHLSKGGKGNRTSYIYIAMEGQEQRFKIKSALYYELSSKTEVRLCSRQGKLGYEFVEEFLVAD